MLIIETVYLGQSDRYICMPRQPPVGQKLLMSDPHVETFSYRIETDPTLVFDNPPPVEHLTKAFTVRPADGVVTVTVTMHEHHASEESARREVDQYLRGWEITAALHFGRTDVRFVIDRADFIDRAPPEPGTASEVGGATPIPSEVLNHAIIRKAKVQRR